jgi:hypothetical protein
VVIDHHRVTNQGAGTSFAFALTLIELLDGGEKAAAIATARVVG